MGVLQMVDENLQRTKYSTPIGGKYGQICSEGHYIYKIISRDSIEDKVITSAELDELFGWDRPAEIEALRFVAMVCFEKCDFFGGFNSLRDNSQSNVSSHSNNCAHNDRVVRSLVELAEKRLVDLDRVEREPPKIAQAGIARSEVIDSNPDSDISDCPEYGY
jgi:hypothetical protein